LDVVAQSERGNCEMSNSWQYHSTFALERKVVCYLQVSGLAKKED